MGNIVTVTLEVFSLRLNNRLSLNKSPLKKNARMGVDVLIIRLNRYSNIHLKFSKER
jgi:hypothetical protein